MIHTSEPPAVTAVKAAAAASLARPEAPAPALPVPTLAPPRVNRMKLSAVVKGRLVRPMRVLLFGIEGVGKSTFAAAAPAPIFLGAEDGTGELDVQRFPQPQGWLDTLDAVVTLTNEAHDYQTLVIDTLDWLEPLCWAHVCATKRDKNGRAFTDIEDLGFGKGYNAAVDVWRVLLGKLERLRTTRNMHVVMLAHSWVKSFKNPAGEDYDRFEMKLHGKTGGLLREWCDAVLFATHETYTHEQDGRTKGISTGARIMHTQRTAAWDAKNRYDLPAALPLDWQVFSDAVVAHRPADPAVLRARIAELLGRQADPTVPERVARAMAAAGDNASVLARIANTLAAQASINTEGSTP